MRITAAAGVDAAAPEPNALSITVAAAPAEFDPTLALRCDPPRSCPVRSSHGASGPRGGAGRGSRGRRWSGRGTWPEAIRIYERLRGLLRDELGTAPSTQAQRLHERLIAHGSPPA